MQLLDEVEWRGKSGKATETIWYCVPFHDVTWMKFCICMCRGCAICRYMLDSSARHPAYWKCSRIMIDSWYFVKLSFHCDSLQLLLSLSVTIQNFSLPKHIIICIINVYTTRIIKQSTSWIRGLQAHFSVLRRTEHDCKVYTWWTLSMNALCVIVLV